MILLSVARKDQKKTLSPQDAQKVFEERSPTCGFCGLQCESYQEIYSVRSENHTTDIPVDPFCFAPLNLQMLAKLGSLIYLPGVSQVDMNNLLRPVFYAYFSGAEPEKQDAIFFLRELLQLTKPVKAKWGSADPSKLGGTMQGLKEDVYANRDYVLKDLLLVLKPSFINSLYSPDLLKDWFVEFADFNAWNVAFTFFFGTPEK